MPLTKKDLEEMMARQKEERIEEMKMLKKLLMEGVKEEIQEQLTVVRDEIKEQITGVREEFQEKVSGLEEKQTEISDVQSIMDCRVDKIEEELKILREMSQNQGNQGHASDFSSDNNEHVEDTIKLVKYAQRVIGFKPIEHRDILRHKRTMDIEDDEDAKKSCLKEFWRCEMRMPSSTVEELLSSITKVWNPTDEENWDKLYVEFKDEKSVKVCFTYCKYMRNKDSQILQFFPQEFRDQYRTLDSIAYKLRNPENRHEAKFKTRYRFGELGLELEKRHPEQRNWTKVHVHHLPPVDLNPVPFPTASNSPPSERSRNQKRPRPSQNSPTSEKNEKTCKVDEPRVEPIKSTDVLNLEKNFVLKNLVDKFASN